MPDLPDPSSRRRTGENVLREDQRQRTEAAGAEVGIRQIVPQPRQVASAPPYSALTTALSPHPGQWMFIMRNFQPVPHFSHSTFAPANFASSRYFCPHPGQKAIISFDAGGSGSRVFFMLAMIIGKRTA